MRNILSRHVKRSDITITYLFITILFSPWYIFHFASSFLNKLSRMLWGQISTVDFPDISRKFSSDFKLSFVKTKKYLYHHPVDCRLEYKALMKIGQPKLCGLLIDDWNTNSIGQPSSYIPSKSFFNSLFASKSFAVPSCTIRPSSNM